MPIHVTNELDSDHLLISISINDHPETDSNLQLPDYFKANWKLFSESIQQNIPREYSITSKRDIETAVLKLTEVIENAKAISIPNKKQRHTSGLPDNIRKLIKFRNGVRKTYQRTRDSRYKNQINNLRRLIKREIITDKRNIWEDKISKLIITDNSVWKVTKNLTKPYTPTPSLHGENGLVYSNVEKPNALADTLEKTFQPNTSPTAPRHDRIVKRTVNTFFNTEHGSNFKKVKKKQILSIIKKLKRFKASGPDNIQNVLLKHLPNEVIVFLMKPKIQSFHKTTGQLAY